MKKPTTEDIELERKSFVHQLRTTDAVQIRCVLGWPGSNKYCALGVYYYQVSSSESPDAIKASRALGEKYSLDDDDNLVTQITHWNDDDESSFSEIADRLAKRWGID